MSVRREYIANPDNIKINAYLPLPQGDGVELFAPEVLVLGEFEQAHGGVCARRQDEDEGAAHVAVLVGLGQVEGRRLHELLAQLLLHKVVHGLQHLHERRVFVRSFTAHGNISAAPNTLVTKYILPQNTTRSGQAPNTFVTKYK